MIETNAKSRVIRVKSAHRLHKWLADDRTLFDYMKIRKDDVVVVSGSNQGTSLGIRERPFDVAAFNDLDTANVHHAACLAAKVASTVGLGFKKRENEKISKPASLLNKFCTLADNSLQGVLNPACEDYWRVGTGYVEIVRNDANEIRGIHHLPSQTVRVFVEDEKYNFHYVVTSSDGFGIRHFARFGDREGLIERASKGIASGYGAVDPAKISEVIRFKRASSLNRWYGWPDWLAATPLIELGGMNVQYVFDFFNNRGCPEFIIFFKGAEITDEVWTEIETMIKATIGLGNGHKSGAINITQPGVEVQVEKLAIEGKSDETFASLHDPIAMDIVSAHGVPPLLAGIQVPGKLGATNELPNALMSFQTLKIGQAQAYFSEVLDSSLGDPALGIPGLAPSDFEFRTIIELIHLPTMDTVARMRQTLPEAQAEGRDFGAGVLKDAAPPTFYPDCVSKKIRFLVDVEGKSHEEAVAHALNFCRAR